MRKEREGANVIVFTKSKEDCDIIISGSHGIITIGK